MLKVSIGKTGHVIEVDFDALPEASKSYIIMYGLKQTLNDAGAAETDPDKKIEAAKDRLAAIKSGTVGIRTVLSDIERATREIVGTFLVQTKRFKPAEARKMVVDNAESAMLEIARAMLATKSNVPMNAVSESAVEELAAKQRLLIDSKIEELAAKYEAERTAKASILDELPTA